MTEAPGLLALAGRLAVAALLLVTGLAAILASLRPRGDGLPGPGTEARPGRPGAREFAALVERSRESSQARDDLAQELRRLARLAVAQREGLDDTQARQAIEAGDWGGDEAIIAFLGEDQLSPARPRAWPHRTRKAALVGDFPERLRLALGFLEAYSGKGQGEDE